MPVAQSAIGMKPDLNNARVEPTIKKVGQGQQDTEQDAPVQLRRRQDRRCKGQQRNHRLLLGAAALVLMREADAIAQGATPLARVVGYATHSMEPALFTVAPVGAMTKLLGKLGWDKNDVDLWEINEAFAMVTMLAVKEMGLDEAKVNVNGGACALGHPIGASGARILVTLIHALKARGLKRGIATLCIGGGEAVALAVELPQ